MLPASVRHTADRRASSAQQARARQGASSGWNGSAQAPHKIVGAALAAGVADLAGMGEAVSGLAAVLLDGCWRLGLELGDQGAGVAGTEPSSGDQLPSDDRRCCGAQFDVGALGLGALGQHFGTGRSIWALVGATAALAGVCSALESAAA